MAKEDLSALRKELEKATGVKRAEGEDEQTYLARVMRKVAALDDKEWKGLSEAAQDWYNDAAERSNEKKDLPSLGSDEPAEEAPRARSRSRAADDEPAAPADPKVGDTVTIKTEDGETYKGEVLEITERSITIDDDGEEEVIKRRNVKSIKVTGGKAEAAKDEPAAEPKVGDTVVVVDADGEEFEGELLEATERSIVVEVKGEEEVFKRAKIKSIKVAGGKARSSTKEEPAKEETTSRRRSTAKDDGEGDGEKRTRSRRGADGESDVQKAWKYITENLDDSFEDVAKHVKKQGWDVKENTLNIKFNDVHKHYDQFKALGLIKSR